LSAEDKCFEDQHVLGQGASFVTEEVVYFCEVLYQIKIFDLATLDFALVYALFFADHLWVIGQKLDIQEFGKQVEDSEIERDDGNEEQEVDHDGLQGESVRVPFLVFWEQIIVVLLHLRGSKVVEVVGMPESVENLRH
jgi:hypothetical protein